MDITPTIRCPYLFERHLDRLYHTFGDFEWASGFGREWVEQTLRTFVLGIPEESSFSLRVMMTENQLSLCARPRPEPENLQRGLLWEYERPNPDYKTLDYEAIIEALGTIDRQREELLLIDSEGRFLEGATSNLLFVAPGEIVVPAHNRLRGITESLLRERLANAIPVREADVFVDELPRFEEILLAGSGKGVVSLNDIAEANWQCRATRTFLRARILHDNALIDYKHAWK